VPQGSVLGPLLFITYITPVSRLIDSHGVEHHSYADDITLYIRLGSDPASSRSKLLACAADVSSWFSDNDLLLNSSKSELIEFGRSTQLSKSSADSSYVLAGSSVTPVKSVKVLGVRLDDHLTLNQQISATCSSCAMELKALRHIRPHLDVKTANAVACSTVLSRVDYCNSLLVGSTAHNINRLQRVQNNAARTVLRAGRRANTNDSLKSLHWLPVTKRIDYKVALITYKTLSSSQPSYIRDMLSIYEPCRNLRSASKNLLCIPVSDNISLLSDRAFQNFAPKLWNSLSPDLRSLGLAPCADFNIALNRFKRGLKTELFKTAFDT
jgi:hypothetical protein